MRNVLARLFQVRSVLVSISSALLLCWVVQFAQAQSGRRAPKPASDPPVPAPTVDPATVAKPAPQTTAEKFPLLVVSYRSASISVSTFDADTVQSTVIRRLGEAPTLAPRGGDEMRRDEAQKRARRESVTPVVWLELEESSFGGSTRRDDPSGYQISYAVFAPQTGQVRAQGRVSLDRYTNRRLGGVIIGRPRGASDCYPTINRSTLDYALTLGAIETANRILGSLNIPLPPPCS